MEQPKVVKELRSLDNLIGCEVDDMLSVSQPLLLNEDLHKYIYTRSPTNAETQVGGVFSNLQCGKGKNEKLLSNFFRVNRQF